MRLSGSGGVSRPTCNEWRTGSVIDPIDREVSGGDSHLDPAKAFGVDASLEWYYATVNILSVGAFLTVRTAWYSDA